MKPNPADEIADRAAEERSENEGMPEHASKARDPVRWAADRGKRASPRSPNRSGIFVFTFVACAATAALTAARDAYRWVRRERLGKASRSGTHRAASHRPSAPARGRAAAPPTS
jgi:hypothetical protein